MADETSNLDLPLQDGRQLMLPYENGFRDKRGRFLQLPSIIKRDITTAAAILEKV